MSEILSIPRTLRASFVAAGLLVSFALTAGCSKQAAPEPANEAAAEAKADEAKADEAKADEAKADEAKPEAPAVEAELGKTAPAFTLKDVDGNEHALESYRGKTVVLEWFNPECPFVKHAHGEGELKTMAKDVASDSLVWLSINSGAPGKQGHGAEATKAGMATFAMTNPVLLDETGEVGHRYGAEKTPHMFVIDGEGTLIYRGAIDNAPMGVVRDTGADMINYVAAALADLKEGRPVGTAESPAYGCSVKYAK
ncbi:MAG: thioredoxin family protein [Nannocystaceae bacterium]